MVMLLLLLQLEIAEDNVSVICSSSCIATKDFRFVSAACFSPPLSQTFNEKEYRNTFLLTILC